jgi:hypothetical protein
MVTTWVFAAVLAEVSGATTDQVGQIVVPVPGATITCTKEGDHLVCVIPLEKGFLNGPQGTGGVAPRARPYKARPPTPAFPSPEALAQLKTAKANVELAKALIPKATTPEGVVLAQQLLYRAKEQCRTAQAFLHTVKADLQAAADPFDGDKPDIDTDPMATCEADVIDATAHVER